MGIAYAKRRLVRIGRKDRESALLRRERGERKGRDTLRGVPALVPRAYDWLGISKSPTSYLFTSAHTNRRVVPLRFSSMMPAPQARRELLSQGEFTREARHPVAGGRGCRRGREKSRAALGRGKVLRAPGLAIDRIVVPEWAERIPQIGHLFLAQTGTRCEAKGRAGTKVPAPGPAFVKATFTSWPLSCGRSAR
jgi:hypothetical protein